MIDEEVLNHYKNVELISDRSPSAQPLQNVTLINDRSASAQALQKHKLNE